MARSVSHFSTFLSEIAGLMGIQSNRLSTEVVASLSALFNAAIGKYWNLSPWLETSPYGEARFLGNRLTYPNNLAKTANWTATAVTVTANSIANPADGATTASKVMETTATSAHKLVQSVATFYPSTDFAVSFYARPNGRSDVQLSVTDGVTTYSAFFNIVTGVVGTTSNFATATMAVQPNGYWLCKGTFTANAAATTSGSVTISLSTDGATLSYAGSASAGVYVWGALVQQVSKIPVQDCVLAWDQTGENVISSIYNVWAINPFSSNYPRQLGYNLTPNGIQVINGTPYNYGNYAAGVAQNSLYGPAPSNPIYIYYSKAAPSFTGDAYSATATYAVDGQAYFTSSTGYGDYYKCIVATTAGQSPDTTPASWEVIPLYETFLRLCLFQVYGDWLISDGQNDKAAGAYAIAQDRLADVFDQNERQMNALPPLQVFSHVTSRAAR